VEKCWPCVAQNQNLNQNGKNRFIEKISLPNPNGQNLEGTKYLLLIDLSALDFDTNTPFSPFSYRITNRDW
jgi:hypothetical protein